MSKLQCKFIHQHEKSPFIALVCICSQHSFSYTLQIHIYFGKTCRRVLNHEFMIPKLFHVTLAFVNVDIVVVQDKIQTLNVGVGLWTKSCILCVLCHLLGVHSKIKSCGNAGSVTFLQLLFFFITEDICLRFLHILGYYNNLFNCC